MEKINVNWTEKADLVDDILAEDFNNAFKSIQEGFDNTKKEFDDNKQDVDSLMDGTSTNPVQNKIIVGFVNNKIKQTLNSANEYTDDAVAEKADYIVNMISDLEESCASKEEVEDAISPLQANWENMIEAVSANERNIGSHGDRITALETSIGDIDTALDNIIAIQNTLIGGETV